MYEAEKKLCMLSMEKIMIGTDEDSIQHGKDFYRYFFENFPELRKYFKGAENFTKDDVQKSERFAKQGNRLLLGMHILSNTFDNQPVFKAFAREMVAKHRIFQLDPALWSAFFTVWEGFLATKMELDMPTKAAWAKMGELYNEECQSYLKSIGLPHC